MPWVPAGEACAVLLDRPEQEGRAALLLHQVRDRKALERAERGRMMNEVFLKARRG